MPIATHGMLSPLVAASTKKLFFLFESTVPRYLLARHNIEPSQFVVPTCHNLRKVRVESSRKQVGSWSVKCCARKRSKSVVVARHDVV